MPRFRPMVQADLPQVCAIEVDSFSMPWSAMLFDAELQNPDVCTWIVAAGDDDSVLAYGGFWKAVDEAHFTNLAVRRDQRRTGLGRALLQEILRVAKAKGCLRATLEVRPSNKAAVALYEQAGFSAAALRPRYYSDDGEDALLMWLTQL